MSSECQDCYDPVSNNIVNAFKEMQKKGHWLESGTIELPTGEKFSYKIRRLKP